MTKKQKKMLIRILIAAVMLVALHFIPVTGMAAAGAVSGGLRRHRLRHSEEGRAGHPQRPGIRRELPDGRGHHRRLRPGHL